MSSVSTPISRRRMLALAPAAIGGLVARPVRGAAAPPRILADEGLPSHFPHQDPALVRAIVGASHSDIDRVRALVEERPALARATWDWGFGDWESALGAASHTGRREIAELLLAHGARPTIFSAAMLGQLDVVRAAVAASPGVQRTPGPHGIPLLAHARAGGDQAASVVAYLEELGDAGDRPPFFSDEPAARAYVGAYAAGPGERDGLSIVFTRDRLQLETWDGNRRSLHALAEPHTFHPTGVPDVTIAFTMREGTSTDVTIRDGGWTVTATRVEGASTRDGNR